MLPLTKEYTTQELEVASELTAEAISRLINYTSQNPNLAGEYLAKYKNKISKKVLEESLEAISKQFYKIALDMDDIASGSSDSNDLYAAGYGISYTCYDWIKVVESIGGVEAGQELKKSWDKIWGLDYILGMKYGYAINTTPLDDCIDALGRLGEHEFLLDIVKNHPKSYGWLTDRCITFLKMSGKKELIQPIKNLLSMELNEKLTTQLREAIAKLEQA